MSIKLMSLVMETTFAPTPKIVLMVMADRADDSGGSLWPSNDEVARKASLSVRQVQRLLHWLDEIGLIKVVGNEHGGKAGATPRRVINVALLKAYADGLSAPKFTQKTGDSRSPVEVVHTGDSEVTPRVTFAPDTGDSEVTQSITDPSINPPLPPKPPEGAAVGVEESFAKVWNAYPAHRQTKRAKALQAFKAANPDAALVARMLAAIELKKGEGAEGAWKREGGRFVPTLVKWIEDRRWEDGLPMPTGEPEQAAPPASQAQAPADEPPPVPAPQRVKDRVVAMKRAMALSKLAPSDAPGASA